MATVGIVKTMNPDNNTSANNKAYRQIPLMASIFLLLFTMIFSGLIGLGLIRLLGMSLDVNLQDLMEHFDDNSSITNRNFFRLSILINHMTMFVIPGIVVAVFCYGRQWLSELKLTTRPAFLNILGGIFLLLVSMPFIQFLFWINQQKIPLPDWARAMETSTADAISNILVSEAPHEFLFNVLIIALLPAIGEELVFRGIIQKQLIQTTGKAIIGIWLTALLFSTFHMQFEGFLPRFVLGALLGYLYYWSENLWVPTVAHFMNNFLQILAQYLYQKEMTGLDLEQIENTPIWQWLPSLVLIFTVGYFLWQYNKNLKNNISKNTNIYS